MIAFMFPGQGSQAVGMGKEFFGRYPTIVEEADEILGYSVQALCLSDDDKRLDQTEYTQPLLFTVNALFLHDYFQQGGQPPDYFIGHSLGEYNALHAAGAISFADGLALVNTRGQMMAEAPKGAMAAILGLDMLAVEALLEKYGFDEIDIANINSHKQIVISGSTRQINASESIFSEQGNFIPLRTSGAFHSRQMRAVAEQFKTVLNQVSFNDCQIPTISNVTSKPFKPGSIADLMASQLKSPVRWYESIKFLMEAGVNEFVEIGPGSVLSRIVSDIVPDLKDKTTPCRPTQTQKSITPLSAVEDWNQKINIGDEVIQCEDEDNMPLKTRSKAILLFDKKPVVYLKGFKGYFELSSLCTTNHEKRIK